MKEIQELAETANFHSTVETDSASSCGTVFRVRGVSPAIGNRHSDIAVSVMCYSTPLQCLDHMRRVLIPDRLREKTGLAGCHDMEVLLDNCGFTVSLIAEELIAMIDSCIESSECSPSDLRRIREAYNSLSGFGPALGHRISSWSYISGGSTSAFDPVLVQSPRASYLVKRADIIQARAV